MSVQTIPCVMFIIVCVVFTLSSLSGKAEGERLLLSGSLRRGDRGEGGRETDESTPSPPGEEFQQSRNTLVDGLLQELVEILRRVEENNPDTDHDLEDDGRRMDVGLKTFDSDREEGRLLSNISSSDDEGMEEELENDGINNQSASVNKHRHIDPSVQSKDRLFKSQGTGKVEDGATEGNQDDEEYWKLSKRVPGRWSHNGTRIHKTYPLEQGEICRYVLNIILHKLNALVDFTQRLLDDEEGDEDDDEMFVDFKKPMVMHPPPDREYTDESLRLLVDEFNNLGGFTDPSDEEVSERKDDDYNSEDNSMRDMSSAPVRNKDIEIRGHPRHQQRGHPRRGYMDDGLSSDEARLTRTKHTRSRPSEGRDNIPPAESEDHIIFTGSGDRGSDKNDHGQSVDERSGHDPSRRFTENKINPQRGRIWANRKVNSGQEKGHSAKDRGQSAKDRGQSVKDRGQSDYHKGLSAFEKDQSVEGRSQSNYEKEQSPKYQSRSQSVKDKGQSTKYRGQSDYQKGQSAFEKDQSATDRGQSAKYKGQSGQ